MTDLSARGEKSASAFRTISEVADELDIPQHVLRFWETKFPQIRPLKRGGGRRYYRPEDVDLLRQVSSLLYREGYTIRGAQKLLREGQSSRAKPGREEASLPLGLVPLNTPTEVEPPMPPARTARVRRAQADVELRAVAANLLEELVELRALLNQRGDKSSRSE